MSQVNMPSGMGGLTRFNEEYPSKFKISPAQVILFIIVVVAFVIALRIFWPIKEAVVTALIAIIPRSFFK